MAATIQPWPWKQFTNDAETKAKYDADPEYVDAKQQLDKEFGRDKITASWIKTCEELEKLTAEIKEKRKDMIPIVDMEAIARGEEGISPEKIKEIRRVGSVIVTGVIPTNEVDGTFRELKQYITDNRDKVTGFPEDDPTIWNVYSTPTQNNLRSHPRLVELMRWVNNLWDYDPADPETSPEPLAYADRVRIRHPGAKFLGLGPHIDSGGLCRWTEPVYKKVWTEVFDGRPTELTCYDMSRRKDANQEYHATATAPTVLRCFQGWTALTDTAPGQGTILLYPNVELTMAYILLRPFFKPPEDESKIMDPHSWTYDITDSWFPGATKKGDLKLSPASHPHLRLEENFLYIPPLKAGDTVWWHQDVCHAVDPDHEGTADASVAYIGATPTTRNNKAHMREQYDKMVAGLPPPDYEDGIDESKMKGFEGFKGKEDVFKTLMGY